MLKTKEEITEWLKQMQVYSYTIDDNLTVDVNGGVDLRNRLYKKSEFQWASDLEKETGVSLTYVDHRDYSWIDQTNNLIYHYPIEEMRIGYLPVKFGKVAGSFDCSNNKLTSLAGSPQSVGRSFNCSNNNLTSLEGSPRNVGMDFVCTNNRLPSLEGAPQYVGLGFACYGNPLVALGNIETEIDTLDSENWFYTSPIPEFASSDKESTDGENYGVSSMVFNTKVAELKIIREEKALIEAQLAKLVEPYDRAKEGPLPSEKSNKPKMKHKI